MINGNEHLDLRRQFYARMADKILKNSDTAYTFMGVVCETVSIADLPTIEAQGRVKIMYKENHKLTFSDPRMIKEFGEEVTLNVETVGRHCKMGRIYFNCNECDNQSIADDGKTCYSCLNYQNIFDDTETKFYCTNYLKKDGE